LTSALENEVEYLWWVEAEDLAGRRTASTQKFRFSVNTTPSVPEPAPIAGDVITGSEALYWAPSTDPDPNDLLTYEMRIVSPEVMGYRLNRSKVWVPWRTTCHIPSR